MPEDDICCECGAKSSFVKKKLWFWIHDEEIGFDTLKEAIEFSKKARQPVKWGGAMRLKCSRCGYVQPSTNPEEDREAWGELVAAGVYRCPLCGGKMEFDEEKMEVVV